MPETLLNIRNLKIGFSRPNQYAVAVDGVSFSLNRGETFGLLGESGCGKTLTSLSIMQLLPSAARFMDDSQIFLGDQDLLLLPELKLEKIRGRKIAMIFQEPMTALNPVMTIGAQITEVLRVHFGMSGKRAKKRVLQLLKEVELPEPEHQYQRFPHQLSGGMKQRAMIAIALAGKPELLIADEPTTALDVTIQAQLLELLKSLQQKTGMSILFISHDLSVLEQMTDRIAVMYAGHLVEEANKKEFFTSPKHPYTKKLFASLPTIEKRDQPLALIPGSVPPLTQTFKACRFVERCPYAWSTCHVVPPRWLPDSSGQHFVRCHLYDPLYAKEYTGTLLQNKVPEINNKAEIQTEIETKTILKVSDLKIYFPIQKGIFKRTIGWIKAVDGVSLRIEAGQTLALVGESGCGKSTLAKGILRLIPTTAGNLSIMNLDITHLRRSQVKTLREHAQIIFQDPFSAMNPRMLIGDIIAEGIDSLLHKSKKERTARVLQLIQQVGLSEECFYRYPHEFSGGQRQRICIARALAVSPKLIICDEPTSALDVSIQAQILNLLKKLQREQGLSYLFITHNMAVVAYLADQIAVMYQGKIVEQGDAETILLRPQHSYTKKLLAAVPTLVSEV
jgi:oligopeptide/dipeptide ABC transporter ATP-binding protein